MTTGIVALPKLVVNIICNQENDKTLLIIMLKKYTA